MKCDKDRFHAFGNFPLFCRVLPQLLQLLDVSRRDRGKLCGASVKTRENVEKKRYNARDRAGYSATLDAAGTAALNPRASGNGALLLDVSRHMHGGARLCV